MKAHCAIIGCITAVVCLAPLVLAQPAQGPNETFLIKAVTSGVYGVKVSEHAEKNAQNEEVRTFAKTLVKDHSQANKDLLEHARGIKVAVVTGLAKDRKAKFDDLAKLSGKQYDRHYMKMMIDGHKEAIDLYQREAQSGANDELKAFANRTLPALRRHLKHAQEIMDTLK
jgi:putative membrane protein